MNPEFIMNLLIFLCSLAGTIYGISQFFKKKTALYLKLVVCGVLCLMFSRLYQVIFLLTQGALYQGFHIGILGMIGSFMFFFSANYGQMDGLVDDRTNTFRKTRIAALAAPLVILLLYLYFFANVQIVELKVVYGVVTLLIMQCAYYNFKHLIIFDVELGIVRCLRPYNALVLVYAAMSMLEPIGLYLGITPVYLLSCAVTAAIALALLPVVKGGFDKWAI